MSHETPETIVDGLRRYIEFHGGVHDDDCPGDDTCECSGKPMNDGANAAVSVLWSLASPPAAEIVISGEEAIRRYGQPTAYAAGQEPPAAETGRDAIGPFFVRDLARLFGLPDDAELDAIRDAARAAVAALQRPSDLIEEAEGWLQRVPGVGDMRHAHKLIEQLVAALRSRGAELVDERGTPVWARCREGRL